MGERIDRRGEVITGETLHLASNDVIYDCRVVNCRVRIDRPRAASLLCSTFVGTTIEVSRAATECGHGCFFDSCILKGKYYSCLFGNTSDQCPGKAGLRNCDFTGATLNLCEFLNCTPGDLRLPGWPHATIFYPRQNAEDFADLATDPVLAQIHTSMGNTSSKIVAATYNMPAYVKQSSPGILKGWEFRRQWAQGRSEPPPPEPVISLEHIRELLGRKPYVFM